MPALSSPATEPRSAAGRPPPDAELITRLYHAHAAAVYGTALRITGNAADAEDVLQDVFVGLPEALAGFQGRGSMEGWLRRLAARLALTRLRMRKRRAEVPLPAPGERGHPGTPDRDAADRLALDRAVAALPESLRVVFVLKEVEGYAHEEIAALLHTSAGACQVRLHRARAALRDMLRSSL
jgi:RNA polymerase sigma-70 factor (ECF subfamily)